MSREEYTTDDYLRKIAFNLERIADSLELMAGSQASYKDEDGNTYLRIEERS